MSPKTYKPGEKPPRSGQYEITGPRGGGTGVERTVNQGGSTSPASEVGAVHLPYLIFSQAAHR